MLEIIEMKILQIICDKTLRNDISNKTILKMTNVKIRILERADVTMVWHTLRMNAEIVLAKVKHFVVESLKRDIPKKRWKMTINKSMLTRGLKESDAQQCAVGRVSCKNWHTSF